MKFLDYKAQKPIFDYLCSSIASFCEYVDLTIKFSAKVHYVLHYGLRTWLNASKNKK